MTDGIIQKVFNTYYADYLMFPEQKRIMESLEQELIKEIDKFLSTEQHGWSIRRELIGDTE